MTPDDEKRMEDTMARVAEMSAEKLVDALRPFTEALGIRMTAEEGEEVK